MYDPRCRLQRLSEMQDCKVCKTIRTFLYMGVPLVLLLGVYNNQPEAERFAFTIPFGIDPIDVMSYGSLIGLIAMISYRAYQEYYLPRRREHEMSEWSKARKVERDHGAD
jgi:disulfide bond formation protein DsbB